MGVYVPENTVGRAACGRKAPASPIPVPQINRFQPAVGWMRLTASMTSTWSRGSASTPPNTAGSFSAYNPASWKASTDSWASLPSASLSSMCASSVPRIRATASSNVWRLAPRSVVSGGNVIVCISLHSSNALLTHGLAWPDCGPLGPFPASATAEGRQLNVPPSPRLRRRRGHSLTCPLPFLASVNTRWGYCGANDSLLQPYLLLLESFLTKVPS